MARRYGFTLIELLVVIAIIAVLAGILFPVFVRVKMSAQQRVCACNEKQICQAAMLYADDNNGWLPPFKSALSSSQWWQTFWWQALMPYVAKAATNANNWNLTSGVFQCPRVRAFDPTGMPVPSIAWNCWAGAGVSESAPMALTGFKTPSRTILIGDNSCLPI